MEHRQEIQSSLAISLTLHALLAAAFLFLYYAIKANPPPTPIQVKWMDKKSDEKNQIVKSNQGEVVDHAKDKAFLSDKNRVVKEESVSKATHFDDVNSKASRQSKAANKQAASKSATRTVPLSNLGVAMLPKITPSQPEQQKPDYSSFDAQNALEKMTGEYIKGLKESEATALNTREFIFYGYFQRIRTQLDQAWQPLIRSQVASLFQRGRRLASEMDYLTRALVVLNDKGEVVEVQVLEESGARPLDDAAVKAFNKAGPFPNPPHGIMDADGTVKIRWDFILRT